MFLNDPGGVGDDSYEVPDGMVAVLRDITAWNEFADGSQLQVFDSRGAVAFAAIDAGESFGTYVHWQGRQVFNTGDLINVYASGSWSFRLSGYLLSV